MASDLFSFTYTTEKSVSRFNNFLTRIYKKLTSRYFTYRVGVYLQKKFRERISTGKDYSGKVFRKLATTTKFDYKVYGVQGTTLLRTKKLWKSIDFKATATTLTFTSVKYGVVLNCGAKYKRNIYLRRAKSLFWPRKLGGGRVLHVVQPSVYFPARTFAGVSKVDMAEISRIVGNVISRE